MYSHTTPRQDPWPRAEITGLTQRLEYSEGISRLTKQEAVWFRLRRDTER